MGSNASQKWEKRLKYNPQLVVDCPNDNKRTALFRKVLKQSGSWMILSPEKAAMIHYDGTWKEFEIPDGLTVMDNVPGAHFLQHGSISLKGE